MRAKLDAVLVTTTAALEDGARASSDAVDALGSRFDGLQVPCGS